MKQLNHLSKIFFILTILTSCLKTAEEINKREEAVNHKEETQKIIADMVLKTRALEEQVSNLQGNYEEVQHKTGSVAFNADELDEVRAQIDNQSRKIDTLEKELEEQRKFIKQVTRSLSKITKALE